MYKQEIYLILTQTRNNSQMEKMGFEREYNFSQALTSKPYSLFHILKQFVDIYKFYLMERLI